MIARIFSAAELKNPRCPVELLLRPLSRALTRIFLRVCSHPVSTEEQPGICAAVSFVTTEFIMQSDTNKYIIFSFLYKKGARWLLVSWTHYNYLERLIQHQVGP